jgi:hypothetical protein
LKSAASIQGWRAPAGTTVRAGTFYHANTVSQSTMPRHNRKAPRVGIATFDVDFVWHLERAWPEKWRATADEDGHYCFGVAL